ncbi:lysophospholipase [Aldersonia sp. NBC_00410]|uniref:alpha/beta hydrolase n=1 Tax=Aldersonia sp. NBC_00410 TaxID=2975954 RepID=UPI00225A77C2|nr:alpha/beta fold hydrolase [Aldersonia sp. NBC_00410]MCX5045389.1 lysophospholipase [Aldersonia sp. NBC_00410]
MIRSDVDFFADGVRCSAWHFRGESERFAGPDGRPVVVMAHGFGGTKDSGLEPFAERLAAAGLDVLAFDYRGFGTSDGAPRQSISITRQLHDFVAAIAAARLLPGADPNRIVLWGSSLSGGHVLRVAAEDDGIAAVLAMTPLTNGLAGGRTAVDQRDPVTPLRWLAAGVRSRIAVARDRDPVLMPLVARPGNRGAMTLDGAYESYLSIAGPSWRNEVDAAVGIELAGIRTADAAKRLRCPVLAQIADFDRYVPPTSIMKTAVRARAQVHHYPCDHFDVWPGHDWFDTAVAHQIAFLTRTFGAATGSSNERPTTRSNYADRAS